MRDTRREPSAWIAPLLSFVAGYVDTVGFVALFGLFTAHVTGNFVLLGASFVQRRGGVLAKLLALPVFVLAVAWTTAFVRSRQSKGHRSTSVVLWTQIMLLGAFLAAGLVAAPVANPDATAAVITGLLGVAAMAVQNAVARLSFGKLAPTTVMTGNVTQTVIEFVDFARANGDAIGAARARIAHLWPPVLGFAIGALLGALLYARWGIGCVALPMLALVAVERLVTREAAMP